MIFIRGASTFKRDCVPGLLEVRGATPITVVSARQSWTHNARAGHTDYSSIAYQNLESCVFVQCFIVHSHSSTAAASAQRHWQDGGVRARS